MEKYGVSNEAMLQGLQTELLNVQQQLVDFRREAEADIGNMKTASHKKTIDSLNRKASAIRSRIDELKRS